MPRASILDFIRELDDEAILGEIKRVRMERERLDAEQQLLEQALAYRRALGGLRPAQLFPTATARTSASAVVHKPPASGATPIRTAPMGSTRRAVLDVFKSDPSRPGPLAR
jgi:hypothetical protein